jgi:ribose transport system substrate-binding protein
MQKRSFIKALLASTMIAGFALPSSAQTAFDGPTSGPKARPSSFWRRT